MFHKILRNACAVSCSHIGNYTFCPVAKRVQYLWPSLVLSSSQPSHYPRVSLSTFSKPEVAKSPQEEKQLEVSKGAEKDPTKDNQEGTQTTSKGHEETSQNTEDEEDSGEATRKRKEKYRQKYTVNSAVITKTFFDDMKRKNKETFLASIDVFIMRDKYLRGHVEFIYAALKNMKEFGVHRDLDAYKKLLNVFPKGKMVARNIWQVEFVHYPKQQYCAVDLLEQMEDFGVMGDSEVEEILANIFGPTSWPSRKHWRMMYWMPKFKNLSPWRLPDPLPFDSLELVKLAIQRITSVDPATQITIYQAKDLDDASDDTWIVSGQSPDQQSLIGAHAADRPIYVEGAFRVWLRDQCINYFILRAEPKVRVREERDEDDVGELRHVYQEDYSGTVMVKPLVHEQEDGTILAVCATGTSSRDSVVSWIRFLQDTNPRLGTDISVVFTLKSPVGPTDTLDPTSLSQSDQEALLSEDMGKGLFGGTLGYDSNNADLSQWGIGRLSDSRFINWPHHFNPKFGQQAEPTERLSDPPEQRTSRLGSSEGNENKKVS
ncbi:unnamed protein product [Allacma fusca]|uniref:Evolutionarily conserved signaling intermediate in Toll pathway, mitochondrial n=1 Tax=Allacma fusca TaxID=39272 RepID=A0A8J2LCD8_9HEXA|nr:unnamed protein product [Allacma fusca]